MKIIWFLISLCLFYACKEKVAVEEKPVTQSGCSAASTGFTPLNDLGTGTFTNAWGDKWKGGLYPNGSNFIPPAHKAIGIQLANQVLGLNAEGNPDAINGKIVWLSIGMSNATQETQQFIPLAKAFLNKNSMLTFVDGAVGGMTATYISTVTYPN